MCYSALILLHSNLYCSVHIYIFSVIIEPDKIWNTIKASFNKLNYATCWHQIICFVSWWTSYLFRHSRFFLFVFVGFFCGVHIGSFYLLCMTSFLPYLHFCVMYFIKFVTLGIYLVFVQLLHSGHVLGFWHILIVLLLMRRYYIQIWEMFSVTTDKIV